MKKRIISILLLLIVFIVPVFTAGCSNVGGSGGGSGGGGSTSGDSTGGDNGGTTGGDTGDDTQMLDLGDYFHGVHTASVYEENIVTDYIVSSFQDLASLISKYIVYEYGYKLHEFVVHKLDNIVVNTHDTHAYAIVQDDWNWNVDVADNEVINAEKLNDMWLGQNEFVNSQINYQDLLTYNLLCVVQGLEPISASDYDEYQQYKLDGLFEYENLCKLANDINHTGLYYYEMDIMAEYILDYVIGEDIVDKDMKKFHDVVKSSDGVATFDDNEYFATASPYDRIKLIDNYNNTDVRSPNTSRNERWDSINWNTDPLLSTFGNLIPTPDETYYDNHDFRADLSEFEFLGLLSDEYRQMRYLSGANLVTQPIKSALPAGQQVIYSGFKNYVNTIYRIVYTAANSVAISGYYLNPINYIEDLHLSNIGMNMGESDSPFITPPSQYKSIVLKPKQAVNINYISFMFGLEEGCTNDIKLEVKGRYQYCTTSHTHFHTELCEFKVKEYTFGVVEIKHGKIEFDAIVDENYFTKENPEEPQLVMKGGGLLDFDLTEAEGGAMQLSAFQAGNDLWVDRYQVAPSQMFIGALFEYRNDRSEFFEFTFNIVEGPMDTKFMFALYNLDIAVQE